ncbi:hypothetical protein NDU88_008141 [Pleurodeles waltl]|uniref:Uncharacterized protein n=1 Tax=Pleurodeles waltl TaxID=8319 RepID=A0AAV7RUX2_PLEWA|nr:hypothetical protein NDU88_008141 [Pleurodeles waltl]
MPSSVRCECDTYIWERGGVLQQLRCVRPEWQLETNGMIRSLLGRWERPLPHGAGDVWLLAEESGQCGGLEPRPWGGGLGLAGGDILGPAIYDSGNTRWRTKSETQRPVDQRMPRSIIATSIPCPYLEQIIRDRRSALQSAETIREPACVSDKEEGSDAAGSDEDSLSESRSEAETVTPPVVTSQMADNIV